ncbi:RHS repeat-associated core domain-containing protein [Actinocrispum sp. NPDC049592]|uniref:RHS repeat-associated core domain-containing protein n=1 Tax=Actinocrispum sp. NPDC049592 TaxID=3154835 RepID=UPI0034137601
MRGRSLTAAIAAVLMVGTSTTAIAAPPKSGWHGLGWNLPALQTAKSVPGREDRSRPLPVSESQQKVLKAPQQVAWPAAASAETDVATMAKTAVPLTVGRKTAKSDPGRVRIETLDRAASDRAGVPGVLMKVAPVSGDLSGPLSVDVDYAGIASAFGADYGHRLTLVSYPDCVLSTPDKPECRVSKPLPTANTADRHLRSEITLPEGKVRTGSARPEPGAAAPMVVAAVAGAKGGEGDLSATSLSPAGSWSAGGSSGAFNYDYPLTLPSPPVGDAPGLSLSYSSGSVDGATSATNNQPSWVGDGWGLSVGGFIERAYKSCAKDLGGNNGQTKTGDQCWATDNATLSLGANSGPMVKDKDNGSWHPQHDDGSKVEHLTGAANGAKDGEYWKVTTTDGVQYFFGLNHLPGWTDGKPETQSTFTAPVFGNNDNEPCHQATFANSWCQQAYRWNLDYVVDPKGNQIAYYYQPETNYYGLNLNTSTAGTSYMRGGYLLRMEYGLNTKAGGAYAQAPARVVFDTAERCLPSGTITCDPGQLNSGTASSWPDVPADQICAEGKPCPNVYPTFFTRKRLTAVTTQVSNGSGGWNNRDKWTLAHTFPVSGDGSNPVLWLDNVVHTGLVGGSLAMPPTTFGGTAKSNRTFASQNYTSLSRYRITTVAGELGGTMTVDYSAPDCQGGAPDPATNTTRCFPAYWTPGGKTDPILDWFNKYVVTDVYTDGRSAHSVQNRTHYDYQGGAAWHFDENFLTDNAYRTWSQWRGYGEVVTTTGNPGDPSGPQTVVKDLFMRGMDGDRAASGTKSVPVKNSLNESIPDSPQYAGFQRESLSYLDGNVFTGTVSDPWSTAATGTDTNGVQSFVTAKAGTRTRTWIAATNSWRNTRTASTFNDKGMPVTVEEDGDVSVPAQMICTRTTYPSNVDAWIHTYPSTVQKISGPCADTNPATSANIISESRNRYDGQGEGVAPTSGQLTEADTLDTWPANGPPTFIAKKTSYDTVYGRPVSTTDGLNRQTTTAYTPATGGPVTQVTTTSPPVTVAGVPTSFTSSTTYDPVSGLPTTKVDQSGLRTDMTYDPLGRLTAVWTPGHSKAANAAATSTFSYAVNTTSPSVVTSSRLLSSGQYSSVYNIVDGLGRTVQVQEPTSYSGGGRVVTDTLFDSQGRSWKAHNSYWNSAAPQGNLLVVQDTDVPNTTMAHYDSANRSTATIYLQNGVEQWRTTTAYDGDRVTTIPPTGGTATAVISNGLGQKVKTLAYKDLAHTGPNDPADATTYTYNRAGQVETVKDTTGQNTWTFGYDLHGNKISQNDPDTGLSASTYDAAGQLTSTKDSLGKVVVFTYDNLGRKTASYDTATTGTKLTSFTYDTLLKGALTTSVRFVSGKAYVKSVTGYDDGGRPTGAKFTIPSNETGLSGSYSFGLAYDPLTGAVARETSPGVGGLPEETIFRTYNALGKPTQTYAANGGGGAGTSLVSETQYNAFGQPLRMNLAAADDPKQVSTTWTYADGTNRLTSSATVRATATDQWVTNRAYTYTPSGALTKVTDVAETQCFGYDYLQRLTQAWTPSTGDCAAAPSTASLGGPAPYWTEWTHDATGNRSTETDHTASGNTVTTLAYPNPGSPQPHAVTSATTTGPGATSSDSYTYDKAGNTLTRTKAGATQTFTYDIEGHVATATDAAGKVSSYVYDAEGNRLLTKDSTGTTLSVGDVELFVATGTSTATGMRFYNHGGQQVAVRTSAGLTWKVADHHGTATASITASSLSVSRRFMDPFGNVRGTPPVSWPDKHSFIGGYQDVTSLVHLGAREYDPAIGRFTAVDPVMDLEDPQSWNGYAYAGNNPVDHSDPTGKYCDSCDLYTGHQIGVDCPPCGGGTPSTSPSSGNQGHYCDGCNSGKGWPTTHGNYPAKVGSKGKPVLDLSKLAKPPLIRDLNRHFQENDGEWYPLNGEEYVLDPIPGYVPPEELSEGTRWLILGGVVAGGICLIVEPCGAIVGGLAEAAGPPIAVVPGTALTTVKGISLVDDALNAGTKAENAANDVKTAENGAELLKDCLGGKSFAPGTKVLMADGSTKDIQDVKVGDRVKATDPQTGESASQPVTDVHINIDSDLTDLTVTGKDGRPAVVHTSQNHEIWNPVHGSWIPAGQVRTGQGFLTPAGERATLTGAMNFGGLAVMYDLTVGTTHTFYVLAGDTPILVHNSSCRIPLGNGTFKYPDGSIRDAKGHFAGSTGARVGASAEANAWDHLETEGLKVVRGTVGVRGNGGQLRYYDGAIDVGNGRYLGIEVKSGGASRTPEQTSFDTWVGQGNTATGVGESDGMTIVGVFDVITP